MNKSPEQFMVRFPGWYSNDLHVFNALLDCLTYEDVDKLAAWCDRAREHGGERDVAHDLKEKEKWHKSVEQSKRRKQLEADRAPKIEAWLKARLKPGMRLKMKGCRDGKGLREFIRWDAQGNLVCWQLTFRRQWVQTGRGDEGHYETVEDYPNNQVTTHFPDKVVRVFPVNGQWTSMLDLIK